MDIRDSQRIKQICDNTEKMVDAFSRIADALEQLTALNSSEKPNSCDACIYNKCGWHFERKEQVISDEKTTWPCEECRHWEHGAGDHYFCALLTIGQECYFEPQPERESE